MQKNRMQRQVWKVEIKKALRSKGFQVAIIIGILICILQMVWVYRNTYAVNESEYQHVMTLSEKAEGYGTWFEMGILEGWLGCEVYSPYNQLYFIIFPLLAGIQGGISDDEIREVLDKVGLLPDDKRKYYKYSLGMRQRLGIAAAIMGEPDVILLDEPINAIDVDGVEEIRDTIRNLVDENRIIIIACHDKEEMDYMADTVIRMAEGRIWEGESV